MGLTVHYKLAGPPDCDAARAKCLVQSMHRLAAHACRSGVFDRVLPLATDKKTLARNANEWLFLPVPGRPNAIENLELLPIEGFFFFVAVGRDCEPLRLGLCRYPATIWHQGRDVPTKRGGWRLSGFSKTQYASLHGWEHFQRCHCAVVELLAALRPLGLRVYINDEGEYWPRRSRLALRGNLGQMNALVAGVAGALKDASPGSGHPVESPIFRHPQFEHLEAEGEARHGLSIRQVMEIFTPET